MVKDFEDAVNRVGVAEGAYSNNPKDNGGETKFGISKRSYPHLNIKDMQWPQAKNIYLIDFWRKLRCDEMPEMLRYMIFDGGVNQGVGFMIKTLQRLAGTKVDGILGKRTIEALQRANHQEILNLLYERRKLRYVNHEDWREFGDGWMARLNLVMAVSV